ncbi:hypothetical protein D9756_006573 [Leucocoprinus leucothites]|uniref:Uncharacterized protein n=1 Tax=Leucocoprinus leucothites TaxID=201217 RepID=A0A8H5G1W7_9AGAR|nr:hypothetical protein D9756_006573 [Leucoagaricus leucothites]
MFEAAEKLDCLDGRSPIDPRDLRQLTLMRDNNRCVLTSVVNIRSLWKGKQSWSSEKKATHTKVTRIISQSLLTDIQGTPEVFQWAQTARAIDERFGGLSSCDVLGEEILCSPLNAFTAGNAVHEEFDCLNLWLTPAVE